MLYFSDIQIPCLLEQRERPWRSRSARGRTVSVLVRCVPSVCEAPKKQLFISAHEREREREGESENLVDGFVVVRRALARPPNPETISHQGGVSLSVVQGAAPPAVHHTRTRSHDAALRSHTHRRAQQLVASRALPRRRRRCGLDSSAAFFGKDYALETAKIGCKQ